MFESGGLSCSIGAFSSQRPDDDLVATRNDKLSESILRPFGSMAGLLSMQNNIVHEVTTNVYDWRDQRCTADVRNSSSQSMLTPDR